LIFTINLWYGKKFSMSIGISHIIADKNKSFSINKTVTKTLDKSFSINKAVDKTVDSPKTPHYFTNAIQTNYDKVPKSVLRRKIVEQRLGLLEPVKDSSEYQGILNKIFRYTIQEYNFTVNLIMKSGYERTPLGLQGLISYCGADDLSNEINCWLTGREYEHSEFLDDEKFKNIIRALEYSLSKLDENYGKVEGKVFRTGYFNPITDKQFYSTSNSLDCAVLHAQSSAPSPFCPYSIIKLKNGHNIYQFQRDTNSHISKRFADIEHEILIDRKSNFRKLSPVEYTDEDINDILNIINRSMKINLYPEDLKDFSRRIDTLKWISVWEEI